MSLEKYSIAEAAKCFSLFVFLRARNPFSKYPRQRAGFLPVRYSRMVAPRREARFQGVGRCYRDRAAWSLQNQKGGA